MKRYANTLHMIPNCALNFLLQEKEHMTTYQKMSAQQLKVHIGVNSKVDWNVRVNDFCTRKLQICNYPKYYVNSVEKNLVVFSFSFPPNFLKLLSMITPFCNNFKYI